MIERCVGVDENLIRYYVGMNEDEQPYVRALLPNGEWRGVDELEMTIGKRVDRDGLAPPQIRARLSVR